MSDLVSMIVPCWNVECYIDEFLGSVINQEDHQVELILVNDGSTDATDKIIRRWISRLKEASIEVCYICSEHQGQAAAMNKGLSVMQGDYLFWTDADDILLPDAVSDKKNWLMKHSEQRIVLSDAYLFDQNKQSMIGRLTIEERRSKTDLFRKILLGEIPFLAGSCMMKTDLFYECYPDGQITESEEGQNLQMLVPAISRELPGFIDKPQMIHRMRDDSHSNHSRSFMECIKRVEGFRRLRHEILPFCVCDQDYCHYLVQEQYLKDRNQICRQGAEKGRFIASDKSGNCNIL